MKNIYLVGFMATGKTSVGRELADRLKRAFFDLDDLIEQRENMRITEIFKQKGEPYFRKLEKELIREISQKNSLIIGCGGGAVVDKDNLRNLKQSGVVICLKADVDVILERSQGIQNRPLLNVEDPRGRIIELLKHRESFYNQSHYIIDTTNLEIKEAVDKIIAIIEKENLKGE